MADLLSLIKLLFHESTVYVNNRYAHPGHSKQFNLIFSVYVVSQSKERPHIVRPLFLVAVIAVFIGIPKVCRDYVREKQLTRRVYSNTLKCNVNKKATSMMFGEEGCIHLGL